MDILITGVTSGIGRALTHEYIKRGHRVIGVARREDRLREIKDEYGRNFEYIVHDISIIDELETLVEKVDLISQEISILINNAGLGSYGEFSKGDSQKEMMMIDVNIGALTVLTRIYLKRMLERNHGGIINVASTASFQMGGPLMAAYYGTKSYVLALDEGIRGELENSKNNRVRVMTLCPGPTSTEFEGMKDERRGMERLYITSPEKVAWECVAGYEAGKEVVIPGAVNRISVALSSLLPRRLQRRMIYRIQKKKRK